MRPREGELYLKFVPPPGFGSASAIADEDYFACGWYEISFCVFIARYRNYVTEVRFEMEEEYQGQISNGISLRDAYEVVFAVDAEFADFLVRLDATEVP